MGSLLSPVFGISVLLSNASVPKAGNSQDPFGRIMFVYKSLGTGSLLLHSAEGDKKSK